MYFLKLPIDNFFIYLADQMIRQFHQQIGKNLEILIPWAHHL